MKTEIYVAGPMTGHKGLDVPRASAATPPSPEQYCYENFCRLRDHRDIGAEAPKYTEAEAFYLAPTIAGAWLTGAAFYGIANVGMVTGDPAAIRYVSDALDRADTRDKAIAEAIRCACLTAINDPSNHANLNMVRAGVAGIDQAAIIAGIES